MSSAGIPPLMGMLWACGRGSSSSSVHDEGGGIGVGDACQIEELQLEARLRSEPLVESSRLIRGHDALEAAVRQMLGLPVTVLEQLVEMDPRARAHAAAQRAKGVTRATVEVAINVGPGEGPPARRTKKGCQGDVEEASVQDHIATDGRRWPLASTCIRACDM